MSLRRYWLDCELVPMILPVCFSLHSKMLINNDRLLARGDLLARVNSDCVPKIEMWENGELWDICLFRWKLWWFQKIGHWGLSAPVTKHIKTAPASLELSSLNNSSSKSIVMQIKNRKQHERAMCHLVFLYSQLRRVISRNGTWGFPPSLYSLPW